MEVVFWTVAICTTVFVAGIAGWRRGFTGQVCAVTGFCIASLCAHIFSSEVDTSFLAPFIPADNPIAARFAVAFLSSAVVYAAVYAVCVMLTGIVRRALSMLDSNVVDSLFGALFAIFNGVFMLSIVMNIWLCLHPEGVLLKLCGADDANAPQIVLLLAPAVFGSPDACDLHHEVQLRDARLISCNRRPLPAVIEMEA
ncbi:MAG: CvpA family protein [Bacteroidales bacterium]|nr:CvpA family protein [Bacteroidales bacterium]